MEYIKKMKQENSMDNIRKSTKLSLNNIEKLEENLKKEIAETYKESAKNQNFDRSKIELLFNQASKIEEAKKSLNEIDNNINRETRTSSLTEDEKNKIYHYYQTGDYSQEDLADIFGTNQPMVSRIIKNKSNK